LGYYKRGFGRTRGDYYRGDYYRGDDVDGIPMELGGTTADYDTGTDDQGAIQFAAYDQPQPDDTGTNGSGVADVLLAASPGVGLPALIDKGKQYLKGKLHSATLTPLPTRGGRRQRYADPSQYHTATRHVDSWLVRNRRVMNPLNPHALRRAIRRGRSFQRYAMKVLRLEGVHRKVKGFKHGFGRKKK